MSATDALPFDATRSDVRETAEATLTYSGVASMGGAIGILTYASDVHNTVCVSGSTFFKSPCASSVIGMARTQSTAAIVLGMVLVLAGFGLNYVGGDDS